MKKLIYALAFCWASVMLISCEKVEPTYVEGKNADERVREFMQEVRSTLIGAPSGWRVGIATPAGLSFTYYMEFLEGNRVRMYSDFNAPAMVEMQESSYALRNTGIPSLIFDSYNYIHIPADPDPVHNNGSAGTGLNGDFEFSIQRISGDTIVLKGNLRSNEIRMIRANQAEWNAVKNGQWPASRDKIIEYFGSRQNTYVNISVGGQTQMMGVDFVDG